MRKIIAILLTVALCLGLLAGCCLSHDWAAATCEEPSTCTKCGKTEGEALGHDWADATCEEPETCEECGATQGEALGHSFSGGSCVEAPVCDVCGAEGDLAEHAWLDATRTAPKTCEVCAVTEGEPLTALEAFPLGQPRYDDKQIYLTFDDFVELYTALVEPMGFTVNPMSLGKTGLVGVGHSSLTGVKLSMMMGSDEEGGPLKSIIVTMTVETDDMTAIETFSEAATRPLQVLLGLDDEGYNEAYLASLENAASDETTIAANINGLDWVLKTIDGSIMLYLAPENAE